MFIKENIMLALAGLKANKMRAILTMLGIIIGIASVIGVVSVGNAMTASVESSMSSMGATNITVNVQEKSATSASRTYSQNNENARNSAGNQQNGSNGAQSNQRNSTNSSQNGGQGQGGQSNANRQANGPGGAAAGGMLNGGGGRQGAPAQTGGRIGKSSNTAKDIDLMTMDQINALQDNFNDKISSISVNENGASGKVKNDTTYANISVVGTNVGYEDVKNVTMKEGRYLAQNDIDGAKNVAVVSDKLASKIFGNDDPIDQQIKVYTSNAIYIYTVVGVYTYKASGGSRTTSDENLTTDLYIPISVEKKTASNKNYQTFQIKPKDGVDVQSFTNEVSSYLSNLYIKNPKFEAQASNMESMLESRTTMMNTVSVAISGIAAISLLVGGIGVMNIMLVSVTERTREIGTRKALGAKKGHIKMQFIVESMIICSIGGILGILLGLGIGAVSSKAMGYSITASPLVMVISFTFSMAIGVFFGYYPAKKASDLDPIEALRYE